MSKKKVLYPDTVNGIYLYEYVMINGIKQYVQVRGKDKSNPLLLMLHGGPGGSVAGLCHVLQDKWEDVSCPNGLLAACYDDIQAPSKKNVIMEKTGHMCFLDQPERFFEVLVQFKNIL